MRINSITVDDFYINPWEVRNFALNQEFKVRGNYPGQRTVSFLNDSHKNTLQSIVGPHAGNITFWGDDEYTGAFQYTVATDRSWIHADSTTDWAGVCYLTPDAPLSSGTGLFRHTKTKRSRYDYKTEKPEDAQEAWDECQDMTKWEMVDRVGNVFNRLILYRADNFHVSLDYFGKSIYDGRLFQVFFFNTEY